MQIIQEKETQLIEEISVKLNKELNYLEGKLHDQNESLSNINTFHESWNQLENETDGSMLKDI